MAGRKGWWVPVVMAMVAVGLAVTLLCGGWILLVRRGLQHRLDILARGNEPTSFAELGQRLPAEAFRLSEELREIGQLLKDPALKLPQLWDRYLEAPDWPTPEELTALRNLAEAPGCQQAREKLHAWATWIAELALASPRLGGGAARPVEPAAIPVLLGIHAGSPQDAVTQLLAVGEAYRTVIRFGILWATYLAATDREEQAAEVGLKLLEITRLQPPFVMGLLTRTACIESVLGLFGDLVQRGSLPPLLYRDLENKLAAWEPELAWRLGVGTERVFALEALRDHGRQCGLMCTPFAQAAMNRLLIVTDELNDVPLASALDADEIRRRVGTRCRFAPSAWGPWSPVVDLTAPAYAAAHQAVLRVTIRARCVRVLSRISQAGIGHPVRLESLGLPPEIVDDPFTSEPLRIIRNPEGWVVYSVGPDGVDNGGDCAERCGRGRDWGIGPRGPKSE